MPWNPFLMKVLLKKRFVSLVNSARDPLENKPQPQDASQKKKKGNAKRWMLGNSLVHKRVLKVCLGSAYFAKIENFLLKILYVGAN